MKICFVADGDHVHGVILSSHVNHGGRTHGSCGPTGWPRSLYLPLKGAENVKNGPSPNCSVPSGAMRASGMLISPVWPVVLAACGHTGPAHHSAAMSASAAPAGRTA